jgi:hypothetical protein
MNYTIRPRLAGQFADSVTAEGRLKPIYKMAIPAVCAAAMTAGPYHLTTYAHSTPPRYEAAIGVADNPFSALAGYTTGESEARSPLADEFHSLVEQWKRDTFHHSSLSRKFTHPAYVRIIGMGKAALPLLLSELRDNPDHWFYALKYIAGDEGKDVAAGIDGFEAARAAWLEWGYLRGYI